MFVGMTRPSPGRFEHREKSMIGEADAFASHYRERTASVRAFPGIRLQFTAANHPQRA